MSENPYESPQSTPAPEIAKKRKRLSLLDIVVLIGIVAVLVALLYPSTRSAPTPGRRMQCKNNLKTIALALHNYHDVYDAFPPAYTVDENGQRLHSWRTLILPWLEHSDRYQKIDLSKPWNHPTNAEVFKTTPDFYRCPSSELPQDFTTYLAVVGENACFHPTKPRAISEITDGTSNTLMVIEVPMKQAVHWMSPHDADEQMALNISPTKKLAHIGGVQAAFADGSVRFLSVDMAPETRRAVISINGREVVGEW
jgi:prepilin-type processing-associated H-X9-DG protein